MQENLFLLLKLNIQYSNIEMTSNDLYMEFYTEKGNRIEVNVGIDDEIDDEDQFFANVYINNEYECEHYSKDFRKIAEKIEKLKDR